LKIGKAFEESPKEVSTLLLMIINSKTSQK